METVEVVEIVIKIPKNYYDACKNAQIITSGMRSGKTYFQILVDALCEGTVLSKGHWIQQPRCEGDEQPDLVCPNCGFKISWWDMGNFCAKCGKGLEGGAE